MMGRARSVSHVLVKSELLMRRGHAPYPGTQLGAPPRCRCADAGRQFGTPLALRSLPFCPLESLGVDDCCMRARSSRALRLYSGNESIKPAMKA